MAMKAVIIGNPNSGSAGDEGYLERFAETLRTGGLEVEVLNTERPDHATELAAMAGGRLVIAAGGDGERGRERPLERRYPGYPAARHGERHRAHQHASLVCLTVFG